MIGIGFYDEDFFCIKSDVDLVSESIIRIISTNQGERVDNPYFGVSLKDYIFEPNDDISQKQIIAAIRQQIATYETRVNIGQITLDREDNYLNIFIKFIMKDDPDETLQEVKVQLQSEE